MTYANITTEGVFTCMSLSTELADFAVEAKSMRVSSPKGAQRSTYWLQLPYRWSLPLMGTMAVLHWLISEAIFIVNIKVLDPYGHKIEHIWRDQYYTRPLSFNGTSSF